MHSTTKPGADEHAYSLLSGYYMKEKSCKMIRSLEISEITLVLDVLNPRIIIKRLQVLHVALLKTFQLSLTRITTTYLIIYPYSVIWSSHQK